MDNNFTADGDHRGVKRKLSLSRCDECETEEAKYRCPNCLKHTCSLACVKQHKLSSGCSGVRDKTMFVPLSEFDEINLLSDYRFLEDTDRLRQRSNRDSVLHASRRYPKEGMWLIRKARAAKVTLKILPKLFSRHRENTTIFKKADGRLHWHLKIHFPQSNAVYSQRFPDNTELCQILRGYIHPSESDPVRRQKLKVYVHSPWEDIKMFMKSEQTQLNFLRYHELDTQKTLGENLMDKTVVEYPEIFVVLKQHSQKYLSQIKDHSSAAPEIISIKSEETHSKGSSHVTKKAKTSDADELEDGEIQSDDDDGDDDVTENTETQKGTLGHDQDDSSINASGGNSCAGGTSETIHACINAENVGFDSQHVISQDILSETDCQANISKSMDVENANIYPCEGHIPSVIHTEGVNKENVDTVDVHSANVYASNINIATDIHVQGSNQADARESLENVNVQASDRCTPDEIHVESSSVASDTRNADIHASDGHYTTDINVESLGQSTVDNLSLLNSNVYASQRHILADIPTEGCAQVIIGDSDVNCDACYQTEPKV